MTLQIDYETDREIGIEYEQLAKKVVQKVLDMEGCPYDAQVNLVLTDNEEIQRVNTEFREIPAPTDVLSFPQFADSEDIIYEIEELDEELAESGFAIPAGDVVICYDKAIEQAEEYGTGKDRELMYLFVHSIFHLLGYDHMEEDDKTLMRVMEERVMEAINLPGRED